MSPLAQRILSPTDSHCSRFQINMAFADPGNLPRSTASECQSNDHRPPREQLSPVGETPNPFCFFTRQRPGRHRIRRPEDAITDQAAISATNPNASAPENTAIAAHCRLRAVDTCGRRCAPELLGRAAQHHSSIVSNKRCPFTAQPPLLPISGTADALPLSVSLPLGDSHDTLSPSER